MSKFQAGENCNVKGELIKVKSEFSSQVKALQVKLSDTGGALQQAEKDISEGKDIQNELQRALQTTKEEVEKLKGELEEAKSQSCPPEKVKSKNKNQKTPSGGKKKPKKGKITSIPSTEEKLKRSENPWKPNCLKRKDEKNTSEDEELLKRLRGILNKLTPQNFQKLMNQTMQLPINSEERLKGVIDLVFGKTIMEPLYCQLYADMCRVMQSIEVKKADGEPVQFQKLIVIKCQKQFERDRNDEQVEKERQRILALTNEKEKKEALAELEYQQMIVEEQVKGTVRFIGELFKLQFFTEKIMQNCIFLLLKANDEESLECMSILVTKVGQSLDNIKGKSLMDQYFHQVDKIIKERRVSSRIRFMLQDLKDLRENNWKPRRHEAKPVMIDQIRKEAEQEKQRKEQEQLAARLAPRIRKRPKGSMKKYQQEDGCNTVPGGRSTKQNVIENPSKLKITRNLTFIESRVDRKAQIPAEEENRMGNFQKDLVLFLKLNLDYDAAFDFIEESIPPELRKTKDFIRALVSAVCYEVVKGEGTNNRGDRELLKSRIVFMQRYIDGNPDLELQALYAVQHLNNSLDNPPGLLRLYFDVLYEYDVISEDTFYAWRDGQDPSEKNGKGIALKSVTSFFKWLEESDPPS